MHTFLIVLGILVAVLVVLGLGLYLGIRGTVGWLLKDVPDSLTGRKP